MTKNNKPMDQDGTPTLDELKKFFQKNDFTTPFRKAWKAMGLNDTDLVQLEEILLENPQKGDVIEGTGGARKLRIQIGNHGKSGGGRVIYLDVLEREHLYLLFAYPKNVQSDLTADQKKAIRHLVEQIKKE